MPGWKAVRRGMVRTRGCAAISSPRAESDGERAPGGEPFGTGPRRAAETRHVDAGAAPAFEKALGRELVEGRNDSIPRDRKLAGEGADRR